ncbi:MAG: peptide ABC transporter substrate-binding protein, partial [Chloroflexi bacterium]|nr:peptide ABC transporter substrate-binding protein [Chloroflexota bacterium]
KPAETAKPVAEAKPAAGEPKRGGQMSLAIISDPTFNPFTWPGQFSTVMAAKPLWSTLVKYEPGTMRAVPDLATSWEPAPDGLTWTFKLRQGVKWHDGAPFTAADVKFTIDNIMNPQVNALFRSNLVGLKGADVVDDQTVKLVLDKPFSSLPIQLGYNIAMAPKHLLDGKDLNTLEEYIQKPIGTGPFRIKEIVKGSYIAMEAFPDFYEGRPNLDGLVFKIVPEINTQVAQLRTGELDLALIEPPHKETLRNQQNLQFATVEQPNTFYFCLNNAREPFNDKRVRLALTLGCNRQLMVERILRGEAPVAAGPYGTAFGEFQNKDLKPYPYDPERAQQLLGEAGWKPGADGIMEKDGKRMSFGFMVDKGNPTREQMALALQQDWKKIGVDIQIDVQEFNVYLRRGNARPGDYDTRTGWRITAPDPDKTPEYTTEGSNNHYMYSNPEVDRLMEQGKIESDQKKRAEIYLKMQQLIYDDLPIIWVYYWTEIIALNKAINDLPQMGIRDSLTYTHQLWRA